MRAQAQELSDRADRAERSAEMWGRGHAGEQTVGAHLELLRPYGFEVLHDLHWPGRPRANIDHVAIGPPGIFVVDAKNWSGSVTVRDGVLRQNGYRRDREIEGARQAAEAVVGLLRIPAVRVLPVIALAGEPSARVYDCQGVTVVGQRDLVAWAAAGSACLTPDDVSEITNYLRAAMPAASLPAPRSKPTPTPRAAHRRPSAGARRRATKRSGLRREALAKLAIIALVLALAPSLLTWWTSHGEDVVRSVIPTPSLSAAAPAAPAPPQVFTSCTQLRAVYPSGVKRTSATRTGRKTLGKPVVDRGTYRANAGLDRDRDGIVCERTAKKGGKKA